MELRDARFRASRLYLDVPASKWPIVFHPKDYNITFCGIEKLHPFDAGKWGHIHEYLTSRGMISKDDHVEPVEPTSEDLMICHTKRYLDSLTWSANVAKVTEVPLVALFPNFMVQHKLLKKLRYQTGGSVLAGKLAIERQWAINIGGGFHHSASDQGGGFCAYADISLALQFLFHEKPDKVKKAMIIDLDAHQGNGHERDFMGDPNVYIMDVFNSYIYPRDYVARKAIRRPVELRPHTETEDYLNLVERHLKGALNEFQPDVIAYNAGTDILAGDPLGCLSVSREGVIMRDELVFREARDRHVPIFMLTSGGYLRSTAEVVADSIMNLKEKGLVWGPTVGLENVQASTASP